MKLFKAIRSLVVVAVLTAPGAARADLVVSPDSYDYGEVAIGGSANMFFNVLNTGTSAVEVYLVILTAGQNPVPAYSGDDFEMTLSPSFPLLVNGGGGSIDVEVTFHPTTVGELSVYLFVFSAFTNAPMQWVPLSGTGVSAPPDVVEVMAELMATYNGAVEADTLNGAGPGSSANGRLRAFGNMLNAANDLIAAGEVGLACEQLQDALDRCDGVQPPPEFIDGPARADIHGEIETVMSALGCP